MNEKKITNLSVKLGIQQSEDIAELIKDKEMRYRSGADFVSKAVEKEIKIADLKTNLSRAGKTYFDMLVQEFLRKAYEEAIYRDRYGIPDSKAYQERVEKEERINKKLKIK